MITTYDELKAAVGSWLKRTSLDTEIPNFIQLAEAHFNRVIRAVEMETRATNTADSEFLALPDDFISMRELHIEGSRDKPLKYVTPQEMTQMEYRGYTGVPFAYTVMDDQIKLFPAPSATNTEDFEMIYLQKIPALSASNTTNWLLDSHPDIYLHGALIQAEGFFYNDRRMPIWQQRCDMAIADLNRRSNSSRVGTGPMMPRVRAIV